MIFEKDVVWRTGGEGNILFTEMVDIIKKHVKFGSKVFIGTDSFVRNKKVTFATAVCLSGKELPNRYFFFRIKESHPKHCKLSMRIIKEAQRTVELAEHLMGNYSISSDQIELHLDVSAPEMNNATSKFSDMLRGYVTSYGLECKIKPNAWASQTVADRHSK